MRKQIILGVLCAALSGLVGAAAEEQVLIDPPNKPPCDCPGCVMKVLKEKNITNVVSLEAKKDHWVAEVLDPNGKRMQVIVRCEKGDKSKKKVIGPYEMKSPPQGKKTIDEIIKIAEKTMPGKIRDIEFRDGQWFVSIFDNVNQEMDLIFDADGVLVSTISTN